ncbi:trypsin-like serine peptidase [Nostoc sp. CMAA1605]|uniref:trypsin-like serine peptidase n=1 Tax=Nostoc sp. CMAA1605 TaxID=2055159 RepID=UPI001F38CDCD|nr:serine protease [Nostoc sp. CMAA1605]MCF4967058.1 hypothetical protein [Nostoc sp. CMAA1605]
MSQIIEFIPNSSIGGLGRILGTSNSPTLTHLPFKDKDIDIQQLLKIILKRIAYKQNPDINANPSMTTVFGQPDFLPFPFLSLGIRRGVAVCRLIREFSSVTSAESFINAISEVEKSRNKYFSLAELAEICCISIQEAENIFEFKDKTIADDKIILKPEYFVEKMKRIPVATGFLVGRNELLTSYHVFPLKDDNDSTTQLNESLVSSEYTAEFNYEQDILGRKIESLEYGFEKLVTYDPDLDFALIRLKREPKNSKYQDAGQAGDQFGWIPLIEDDSLIAPPLLSSLEQSTDIGTKDDLKFLEEILEDVPKEIENIKELKDKENVTVKDVIELLKKKAKVGDPVNIIQHPKGRYKEVVLSNNRVQKLLEDFILYEADADFSSSGSPVMNQQWQLVGLHCGAIPKNQSPSESVEIDQEIGVRTYKIVKKLINQLESDIKKYSTLDNEKQKITIELWFFVKEFVQLRESKDKIPQLPNLQNIANISGDKIHILQQLPYIPSSLY